MFKQNFLQGIKDIASKLWLMANKHPITSGAIGTVIGSLVTIMILSVVEPDGVIDPTNYFDTGEVPEIANIDATKEYQKIRNLNAGINIEIFKEILGEHTFVNRLSEEVTEYVFVNPLYYVNVAVNLDNIVVYYTITTRKMGFNPKLFLGPWYEDVNKEGISLARSKFGDLNKIFGGDPIVMKSFVGANWFYYTEGYYVGRPANYQTLIFSINQAGYYTSEDLEGMLNESNIDRIYMVSESNTDFTPDNQEWNKWREKSTINTYTVTAPGFGMDDLEELDLVFFGPDPMQVRVLELSY